MITPCECDVCAGAPYAEDTASQRRLYRCKHERIAPPHKELVHTAINTYKLHENRLALHWMEEEYTDVVEIYDHVCREMKGMAKENERIDKLLAPLEVST